MWFPITILAVIIIVAANFTRRQWPRNIFDLLIYACCAIIALDYYL